MMTPTSYEIRSVPPSDLVAALRCEGDRAEAEGMINTAKRQRALALHIENAVLAIRTTAEKMPVDARVDLDIVIHVSPDVNPSLRPEYR